MKTLFKIFFLAFCFLVVSCTDDEKTLDIEEYTGPLFESENVEIMITDSTVVKIIMSGAKQLQHQNGDIEFPQGIKVTFYDKFGEKISELTAQEGYKAADDNFYRARGDVHVQNLQKKETLSTEELFWNPDDHEIYTDKFVTIETPDELILAEGMRAPEDFSTYVLIKPQDSIFKLEEQ